MFERSTALTKSAAPASARQASTSHAAFAKPTRAIAAPQAAAAMQTATPCRRGPSDLILPPELHRQVLEIAGFIDALPRVADGWGFGRYHFNFENGNFYHG